MNSLLNNDIQSSDISNILEESKNYSSELPNIEMGIHDTCALFYSSGTTGFPKAVEITHDNFVSQCMLLDDPGAFNFSPDTVNVSTQLIAWFGNLCVVLLLLEVWT